MRLFRKPRYLQPYLNAVRRHGAGFESLLWASPATQAARFEALARACLFHGLAIMDIGCGRADLLDFLISRGIFPTRYVGIEAVEPLAHAAEQKPFENFDFRILRADFVRNHPCMAVGADVAIFCGSLNTLGKSEFYAVLRAAYDASSRAVAFNFLDSPKLAAAPYLTWHRPSDVRAFAFSLTPHVSEIADYMDGDRTMAIFKPSASPP